jgi:archaellum component FlaC
MLKCVYYKQLITTIMADKEIDQGTSDILEMLRGLTQHMDKRFDALDTRIDGVEQRLGSVEQRLENVEERLDRIEFLVTGQERRISIAEDRIRQLATKIGLDFAKP